MEYTNRQIILYDKERRMVQTLLKLDEVSRIVKTRSNWWFKQVSSAFAFLKGIKSEEDKAININERELIYFSSNVLQMILITLPDELYLIEFIKNLKHTNVNGKKTYSSMENLTISFDQTLNFEHKVLFLFLAYACENSQ